MSVGMGVSVGAGIGVNVGKGVSDGCAVGVGGGAAIPQADKTTENNTAMVSKTWIFFIGLSFLGGSPRWYGGYYNAGFSVRHPLPVSFVISQCAR
jgi:hypothetical protein